MSTREAAGSPDFATARAQLPDRWSGEERWPMTHYEMIGAVERDKHPDDSSAAYDRRALLNLVAVLLVATPEPPDSGDAAARCSECGVPIAEHPDTDACAVAQESRDAGIDAALLALAMHRSQRWCDGTEDTEWRTNDEATDRATATLIHHEDARAVVRELARLRSGSPAPEGGE